MTAHKIRDRIQAREGQIQRLKNKRDQANGHKQVARADELTLEINRLKSANSADQELLAFVQTPRSAHPEDARISHDEVKWVTAQSTPATG